LLAAKKSKLPAKNSSIALSIYRLQRKKLVTDYTDFNECGKAVLIEVYLICINPYKAWQKKIR
jgi:hypothetical protein